MIKTLLTIRYPISEHVYTFLKGVLASLPICILLFTAQEFGWYNAGDAFFEQISSAIVFGISFVWSCYIFIITFYYKNRQMVTSIDGIVVAFFLCLGAFSAFLVAQATFWSLEINWVGSVILLLGVLQASITLGYFVGQSKAKFDSDEVGSWKTRISGFILGILMVSLSFFCSHYTSALWIGFLAVPAFVGCTVLNYFLLARAQKQYSRYIAVKKRSERNIHAFYPHMQVGGELINQH